ncbi:Aminoglycoside phosphotransferase [Penicillium roqueforti FM164]|uniref:Aminoglycoside phosphotransferase n=1 Tax=Penicillium roqueforti (strain FM164) TaxID=1365484 RepID=W6QV14_PENRF|nr:Aminoglycoside phosphotransferase [Penicillium roqueforti FM164]
MDIMNLVKAIYGTLTPQISFKGQIGDNHEIKEPLYIYVMNRMLGISQLDFILAHNGPQDVDQTYRESLCHQFKRDLNLLLASLPIRFHPLIKKSLDSLPAIFSLPLVLLHNDFGSFNMLVNENSCNLLGMIDWAEAEIAPFGINLYAHDRTGVDNETIKTIKAARIAGVLLWLGFTSRLPNEPKPVPIPDDDESGAYGMRDLELLINPATRFTDLV